jgi:glycine C-acetyltransferase
VTDKLTFIDEELSRLRGAGLFNEIRTLEGPQGARVRIQGRDLINMCSNNYLGLANDERLRKAAVDAIRLYGVGPGAVRSIAGTETIHLELERKAAAFKKAEAAISVQSGFMANVTAIPSVVSKDDTIISDELNHASIIDACRLSRAEVKRYAHNDMDELEQLLRGQNSGRVLIVSDGVFSMDGDIADVPHIVELADRYGALTMIDDAHGDGVLGEKGRGISDHFHLHGKIDIEVGTFSKAIGTVGGVVVGSDRLISFLKQKARPFLFSSAVTPADVGATIAALDILEADDSLVKRLWDNGNYFKTKLNELGFNTGHSQTPITPVMLGEAALAANFSRMLFEEGVFASKIAYPTVAQGKARIRVMISAAHSRADLDEAIAAFARVGRELKVI